MQFVDGLDRRDFQFECFDLNDSSEIKDQSSNFRL